MPILKQFTPFRPTPILPVKQHLAASTRKKRRLLIDPLKAIPNSEFKVQLQDTSDIVGKVDLAPATKKAMHQLTYFGVGKYFAYPGRKILSGPLSHIFLSHLTVTPEPTPAQAERLEPLNSDLRKTNCSENCV